jgi:hypothetical protein
MEGLPRVQEAAGAAIFEAEGAASATENDQAVEVEETVEKLLESPSFLFPGNAGGVFIDNGVQGFVVSLQRAPSGGTAEATQETLAAISNAKGRVVVCDVEASEGGARFILGFECMPDNVVSHFAKDPANGAVGFSSSAAGKAAAEAIEEEWPFVGKEILLRADPVEVKWGCAEGLR